MDKIYKSCMHGQANIVATASKV